MPSETAFVHSPPAGSLWDAAAYWMRHFQNHRRVIAWVFAVNVLGYFIFISQFMLQNHGIYFPWVSLSDQVFAGRWFTSVLFWINGGANTPVITPLLTISFTILAAVVAVNLWGGRLSGFRYFLVLSLFTLYPAFTEAHYYHYVSAIYTASILLAVLALQTASRLTPLRISGAAFLVCFSLATYQPALSSLATAFCAYCIASLLVSLQEETPPTGVIRNKLLPKIIAVAIGGLMYKLSLALFTSKPSHATTTIGWDQAYDQFQLVLYESFAYLVATQPEFSPVTKLTLLAVALLALTLIFRQCAKSTGSTAARLINMLTMALLAVALVMATKAMFLISDIVNFFPYRYHLSLALFYSFALLVVFSYLVSKPVSWVALALAVFLVVRFIQVDLLRQGVLMRGQIHDLALANRILYRIESLPGLDPATEYVLVKVGEYPDFRSDALAKGGRRSDLRGSEHMDGGYITEDFAAGAVMQLLGSSIRFDSGFNHHLIQDEEAALLQIRAEGRKPWPDPSSVFVMGSRIVVYLR